MSATEKALIEKIKQLPPQRLAEVDDFVDFLQNQASGAERQLPHTPVAKEKKLASAKRQAHAGAHR